MVLGCCRILVRKVWCHKMQREGTGDVPAHLCSCMPHSAVVATLEGGTAKGRRTSMLLMVPDILSRPAFLCVAAG